MRGVWCEIARRTLIQSFRAMQAIAESGFTVIVPPGELSRWEYSAHWFQLPYAAVTPADRVPVHIDHETPSVVIGDLSRPLLFPHRAFELYGSAWAKRVRSYTFTGFPTPSRKDVVNRWRRRIDRRDAFIQWSKVGRGWPEKAWDPEYVEGLGSSRFALCPDGDFVWTYRFFEAIACGAIPVVESVTTLYDGFVYYRMEDEPHIFEWNEAVACANYERALRLLTIPISILQGEVLRLIDASQSLSDEIGS
jgi:hypothetical protein